MLFSGRIADIEGRAYVCRRKNARFAVGRVAPQRPKFTSPRATQAGCYMMVDTVRRPVCLRGRNALLSVRSVQSRATGSGPDTTGGKRVSGAMGSERGAILRQDGVSGMRTQSIARADPLALK